MNRWIGFSACLVLLCHCLAAGAQDNNTSEPEGAAAAEVTEEIVVRGDSRTALRTRIEMAEDAIFDRFNEINSNDEFDIRCRLETFTGTRIPQRVCQANYWRNALTEAGKSTLHMLRGSSDVSPAAYKAEALYKTTLFEAELTRLASEDKQLLQAIRRFNDLTATLDDFGDHERRDDATISRTVTSAEQELPYDALLMAEVRVRREPWSHVLSHSTFAIAHVYGEIERITLNCREQSQALKFEPGAEWRVPLNWEPCSLSVEAGRGTAFSLYEFD
ncbi:MAG TPA: hypothetical protein VKQ06_10745 [Gammaproteobacteria bacterium]|nr:hypothetical protein [Gammaproteobacteria bacterium]